MRAISHTSREELLVKLNPLMNYPSPLDKNAYFIGDEKIARVL